MQEDWDRIVEVAAGSGASLDAAAQASAVGDAGAAQTALNEAADGLNRSYG